MKSWTERFSLSEIVNAVEAALLESGKIEGGFAQVLLGTCRC